VVSDRVWRLVGVLSMLGILASQGAVLCSGADAAIVTPDRPPRTYVLVTEYGATADSNPVDDDLGGFQAALANTEGYNDTTLPVKVPAGVYDFTTSPYRLTIADGSYLYGTGIGNSIVNGAVVIGSSCLVGGTLEGMGITFGKVNGSSGEAAFGFTDGASDSIIRWCRFRGDGGSGVGAQWELSDWHDEYADNGNGYWTSWWWNPNVSSVLTTDQKADFHDIAFVNCEFEHPDDSDAIFSIWWDSREGGGEIYDVTWQDCTFGCRDNAGEYLDGGLSHHLLLQQGPPEHGPDGPRPNYVSPAAYLGSPIPTGSYAVTHNMVEDGQANLVDWWIQSSPTLDLNRWSLVDHGAGEAIAQSDYGITIDDCVFWGETTLMVSEAHPNGVSVNPCDLMRSAVLSYVGFSTGTTYYDNNYDYAVNGDATEQGVIAGILPQACILGMTITDCWSTGDIRPELGYGGTFTGNTEDSNGTYAANVPSIVQTHDVALYGSY
jgi:hypothetical protein